VRVYAELESLAVHVVREGRNAMRAARGVRDDGSVSGARHLPAVIDHNVLVSGIAHSIRSHRVSRFTNQRFADVATKMVPAVPSHRWRQRESIVDVCLTRLGSARTDQCERQYGYADAYLHAGL